MAATRKTGTLSEESEIFWSRVHKGRTCWEWQAGRTSAGYGLIYFQGSRQLAHRVAWQLEYGPIPEGRCVCHHCDNPRCVRPDHLFVGTHKDNMNDMHHKGRAGDHRWWRQPGRRHHKAKITQQQASEIRLLYATTDKTQRQLASQYGVSQAAIWHVLHGKSWA